ncbi:HAD-IIIC family phosphatase [Alcaligenes sp. WGS1538]|uniref:HAD-IIIC family phosphatase n=1 Tax=Alcaligenes sp. WGS1538 TaxID=3366811 RepID=UPI00372D1BDA
MNRFRAQDVLFAERPSRLGWNEPVFLCGQPRPFSVNVWRNHNFESFAALAAPYLDYAELAADFHIGAYDDSFGFEQAPAAELELLWLDPSPYQSTMSQEQWLAWLQGRLLALRQLSQAPIVLATWNAWQPENASVLQALVHSMPGVQFADLHGACAEQGVPLLDRRTQALAGTPLSRQAQPLLARLLGLRWLPACVLPPVKAIAVDLDNTLHAGVLGEDGASSLVLEPAHLALQQALLALKERGVFITLVSRNDAADVQALFQERRDYPLALEDFALTEVSWDSKGQAILRIARQLNISPDAVLFIDDNPGELLSVRHAHPGIKLIHADPGGLPAWRVLSLYPGLWRWTTSDDDLKRVADWRANSERQVMLRAAVSADQYFASLGAVLELSYDEPAQLPRLADLCRKTNQFNLSLKRYSEAQLHDFMMSAQACVAAVSLSDSLSSSGIIAVVVASLEAQRLVVKELCMSCRALGRRLEDMIIFSALRSMPVFGQCREVVFELAEGPRNQPAREWLAALGPLQGNCLDAGRLREFELHPDVTLMWKQA